MFRKSAPSIIFAIFGNCTLGAQTVKTPQTLITSPTLRLQIYEIHKPSRNKKSSANDLVLSVNPAKERNERFYNSNAFNNFMASYACKVSSAGSLQSCKTLESSQLNSASKAIFRSLISRVRIDPKSITRPEEKSTIFLSLNASNFGSVEPDTPPCITAFCSITIPPARVGGSRDVVSNATKSR